MTNPNTRILLLIEDNPGDAQLVGELLCQPGAEDFKIIHAPSVREAIDRLAESQVDVVVLDLRLPDCAGVDTVKAVREVAPSVPIVVLTGTTDEELALACIHAGAQDYLLKADVRGQHLRRAIGYAITRLRETQMRELQETLERYRAMSSTGQGTLVTAAMVGSGVISLRSPETFESLTEHYCALLVPFSNGGSEKGLSRGLMERVATAIGDAGGGPRDLLDIHIAALDRVIARHRGKHTRSTVIEARLLALQMMGLLVDYYRVGQRRRFAEGLSS